MNAMRMGLFCALIGWMVADAQAQLGTYGSPDPIPLGQYTQQPSYVPAVASRGSYATTVDNSGPKLPPAPYGNIPQPPSESSAVSTMLNEPHATVSPSSGCNMLPTGGCIKDAGNCDVRGDVCGGGGCCSPWFASLDTLYMTRNRPNKVYTSAEANHLENQGYFNDANWTWGGQASVGYRFGCGCDWALQGTYWGLADSSSDGNPGITQPYVTPMIFGLTDILGTTGGTGGGVQTANNYFDQSPDHHIWRNYEAQNLELNLVRTLCGGECNRVGLDFMVGVRWFRFQDGLVFGAQRDPNDGSAYAGDWIYLNDRITNDLVGLQAGFNASYRFADCWKAFITPKFGVYNNHMTLDYNVYAVSSTSATQYQASSQTYPNQNYPVHAGTDGFAFMTQVDLGLDWQVTRHVSTQLGYRVVAVTGMGLADNQIPFYGNDTQAIADIDRNGSLILHGAFGGLTFSW
ncbi:MAG: BBP7 family outer membrane beta-barrel protein [Planctomycetota bacterium]